MLELNVMAPLSLLEFAVVVVIFGTSPLLHNPGFGLVEATPADGQGSSDGQKQHFRVTTVEEKPYVMRKAGASHPPKNSDFDGYIPELLSHLASELNFNYTIHLVADGKYGGKNADDRWNGMIGEVVYGTADIAAAAITVSEQRKAAVDFTRPFMTFDSAILMKKSSGNATSLPTIKSLDDLGSQDVITYGVINHGVTESYFSKPVNNNPLFQRMWQHMSSGNARVANSSEGVNRVRESFNGRPYAFITEGITAEYWVNQQPCDLMMIKVKVAERHYALAVKKKSPMREKISVALDKMDASGKLAELHSRWWKLDACSSGRSSRIASSDAAAAGIRLLLQVLAAVFVSTVPSRAWILFSF